MRKAVIALLLVVSVVLPASAVSFGKTQAQDCGLFDAVSDNYSLFGGLDEDSVEFGFSVECDTSPAHPAKWMAKGVLLYWGVVYMMLPDGVDPNGVVVTKESGNTFTKVDSYSLNGNILMFIPDDEHATYTVIRPGSKWCGLSVTHVH